MDQEFNGLSHVFVVDMLLVLEVLSPGAAVAETRQVCHVRVCEVDDSFCGSLIDRICSKLGAGTGFWITYHISARFAFSLRVGLCIEIYCLSTQKAKT